MRKLGALGILASVTALASLAYAQQPQPQPQPTTTGGVQPLPPPQTSATPTQTQTAPPPPPPPQPLPTIAPTTTATVAPTVTATVPPPPPPPTVTATATATAPPPPPVPSATTSATTTTPPPPPTTTATTPPPTPPPTKPAVDYTQRRADGEMIYLYGTSAAYGITMGAWIDTLSLCSPNNKKRDASGNIVIDPVSGQAENQCDPAAALVAPLLLGTVLPLGFFLWDNFAKGGMHKGVPSSISTGLIVGALEGLGVAGANYAVAGPTTGNRWGSDGIMTSVFVGATLGGIGGYAFGEAVRPDPRKIALVASGAGWGAMMGAFFGGGAADSDSSSIGQGALVGNLVGINVGLATTGILAAVGYDPSWSALKYMWLGAGIGVVATSPIYLIYVASQSKDANGNSLANHGLVANGLGMLAGIVIAGILTRDLKDPESAPSEPTNTTETTNPNPGSPNAPPSTTQPAQTGPTARRPSSWTPPISVSFAPLPNGGMFSLFGQW